MCKLQTVWKITQGPFRVQYGKIPLTHAVTDVTDNYQVWFRCLVHVGQLAYFHIWVNMLLIFSRRRKSLTNFVARFQQKKKKILDKFDPLISSISFDCDWLAYLTQNEFIYNVEYLNISSVKVNVFTIITCYSVANFWLTSLDVFFIVNEQTC